MKAKDSVLCDIYLYLYSIYLSILWRYESYKADPHTHTDIPCKDVQ